MSHDIPSNQWAHDDGIELDDEYPTFETDDVFPAPKSFDPFIKRMKNVYADASPESKQELKDSWQELKTAARPFKKPALYTALGLVTYVVVRRSKNKRVARELAAIVEEAIDLKVGAGDAARLQAGLSTLRFEDTPFGDFELRAIPRVDS